MAFETFAVHAACIRGVEAIHVTVEVSLAGGVPGIQMLGIPSMEVMESRGRIRCAMRSAGFEIPRSGITVNLAPGDIRKTGSGFDLPIAIAVLAADEQIPRDNLDRCLIAGELGLDGTVLPVKGEVAFQLLARDMGLSFIAGRSDQHVPLAGVDCGFIDHLSQLAHGMGDAARHYLDSEGVEATFEPELDYADVLGQEVAKRGMALAAAGELGLLMIGSPGSGKTMLARRMTGILPELSVEDQQEALCIHSVLGENIDGLLAGHRPFRSPHHSISTAGLIGGGRPVHPGEISLAHGGVLFLDELAEFPTGVLQTLRQPIERGYVRIVRVDGAFTFPSRFQLLAASNPCPCGFLGDREVPCRCSAAMVERYRSKLRGPLADRIDMMIDVTRPDPQVIIEGAEGMSSAELRDYVVRGRAFRAWRESRMDDADAEAEDDETRSIDGVVSTFELDDAAEKCARPVEAHASHRAWHRAPCSHCAHDRRCRRERAGDAGPRARGGDVPGKEGPMMAEGTFELHPGDALYPETVLELSDVPQTLYVRGNPEALSTPALSIIGARKASPYGLAVAELAAKVAVEAGVTVVSGGAVGCDQASGWAAVNAGGKHVVVLGTGADVVYPRSSAGLITRTLDTGGAVVSISPWGMGPRKFAFPRRNRVIAALSQALFVSEAGMPSGTFSTAEAAMDLGRELLAVPGSILSPESRGTNYLIANGACCIVDEESIEMAISRIYGTLRYSRPDAPGIADLNPTQQTVMHALIASPLKVDDIAALVSLDAVGVLKLLGSLELEGLIERMMDGRYAPSKFALHAQTPFGHNGKRVN